MSCSIQLATWSSLISALAHRFLIHKRLSYFVEHQVIWLQRSSRKLNFADLTQIFMPLESSYLRSFVDVFRIEEKTTRSCTVKSLKKISWYLLTSLMVLGPLSKPAYKKTQIWDLHHRKFYKVNGSNKGFYTQSRASNNNMPRLRRSKMQCICFLHVERRSHRHIQCFHAALLVYTPDSGVFNVLLNRSTRDETCAWKWNLAVIPLYTLWWCIASIGPWSNISIGWRYMKYKYVASGIGGASPRAIGSRSPHAYSDVWVSDPIELHACRC